MSMEYQKEFQKPYVSCPETCSAVGFQDVMIGVPVEIKPFATVGKIHTECISEPVISKNLCLCEEKSCDTCKFIITQKIRVEIPVTFGAKTEVSKAIIDCKYNGCTCEECFEKVC
ncbi:MAG: hypothetical protein J6K87_01600 [Clostridia bacterium]|nr:hypothetical protein [Clostridia bacterium]